MTQFTHKYGFDCFFFKLMLIINNNNLNLNQRDGPRRHKLYMRRIIGQYLPAGLI